MQLIESHGTFKNESLSEFIILISGALWLADDQCNGKNAPNRWANVQDMPWISVPIKMESWADVSPSHNKSLSERLNLLLGKPNYLGICFQQPPATLH